jgi:uncharacterized protein (UPF0262 family)
MHRHLPQPASAEDGAIAGRLVALELDPATLAGGAPALSGEREAAVRDLLAENRFCPAGRDGGAFRLALSTAEGRLVLAIAEADGTPVATHILALSPLRRTVRDYLAIVESYVAALRGGPPGQIEAIDMGRRALHNEAAEALRQRLAGKVAVDFATARRLFTLIAALHWKG